MHYDLGSSKISRLIACPGSRRLNKDIPNRSSSAADDGSDTHELIAKAYDLGIPAVSLMGSPLPFGGIVTQERAERAQVALDYYASQPGTHFVEEMLDMSTLLGEPAGGTADFYSISDGVLSVADYKDGFSAVSVDTEQLLYCATGAAMKHGSVQFHTVRLAIIQPRVYNEPQVKEIPFSELNDWVRDVLVPAASATRDPDAHLNPGEKQCQWCGAKASCPALMSQSLEMVQVSSVSDFEEMTAPPAPAEMDDRMLQAIVLKAPLLKSWIDAAEEEARRRLMGGAEMEDLKLVRGRKGNRQWKDGMETAVAQILRENCGLSTESIYDLKLLGPAKVMKLPAVKGKEDLLTALITQSEGAICLVPASNKSPALLPEELNSAVSHFTA